MISDQEILTAIKIYMKQLPYELQSRHGGTGHDGYTAGQVEAAIRRSGLPMEYAPYAMALFCFESEFRRALSEKPDVLETVLRKLKGAANAGSIDVDGWSIGTWLTERLVDTLTGDDVGEIGSEGGGF